MRDLLLLTAFGCFLVLGAAAPFIFALGYVWVDAFRPQEVTYGLFRSLPVAMVMGAAAIGGWFVLDRRDPPRPGLIMVLTILLAVWVTLSTVFWAVVPGTAWWKWDWAFKTIVFSAFIPFAFRSRVQIEAFLQIYLFAIAAHYLPYAGKTILAGGGYGRTLGLIQGNSGIAEGATLATVALMLVPIALFLRRHTLLMPRLRLTPLFYLGLAVAGMIAAVGTYQRTALVGMAVLAAFMLMQSRRKWLAGMMIAIGMAALVFLTSDAWNTRISTIGEYRQESSALTRLLVWEWTLGFVQQNPFGGGFGTSEISRITPPAAPGTEPEVVVGRAFHSVYFEILGEQGWVGLALFFGLVGASLLAYREIIRRTATIPELAWAGDLARTLRTSLMVLLACGAFIGIAFQPMFYYLFGISAALLHQVRRSAALLAPEGSPARRSIAPIGRPGVALPRQQAARS
jgi:probable O-glycosylation ligase (exosortase A-associated)